MINLTVKDNLNIQQIQNRLNNVSPLIAQWRDAREDIFQGQYEAELNPENQPLRRLSKIYLEWKNEFYPGKKKRELTGKTRESHRFYLGNTILIEEIGGNAIELEEDLGLPIFPETWSNPTEKTLVSLAERYMSI